MGWIPPATTFYYSQRSKCADLPELLQNSPISAQSTLHKQTIHAVQKGKSNRS